MKNEKDNINPSHYQHHPSGIECIEITQHMNFNLGNALKYLRRSDLKHDDATDDLNKSIWYIMQEMRRLGLNCKFSKIIQTEEEYEAMRNGSKPGTIRVEAILDGYCDCGKKTEADFSAGMCYKCGKGLRS